VKIKLPNSANLQNITGFLREISKCDDNSRFDLEIHKKWVAVHPAVLALEAAFIAHQR
jgi:hypothetical protein